MARRVLLFDGVCTLCNKFVQFVLLRDPAGRFQFAPLQSAVGQQLLLATPVPGTRADSLVLVEGDRVFMKSTAALRVLRGLRFPWSLAYLFVAVPRPLRDRVYDVVARHRYQWFGRRDVCLVPTPELRARFLSD